MRKMTQKGFTLVELLVVITILAIISVVAYQNFGGATDKAINGRKISDISTLETSLQQFRVDKNYYPMPQDVSATNLWGYNSGTTATPTNTVDVTYNGQEISAINSGAGGGIIYGTGANGSYQIGAKGVIGYSGEFAKNYLSKELYDPELGDISVGSEKMIDKGIGKYVFSVYSQPRPKALWNRRGNSASYYNIATTIKQENSELYASYIVGDYDNNACNTPTDCPETLIGTASGSIVGVIKNGQTQDLESTQIENLGVPYLVKDL